MKSYFISSIVALTVMAVATPAFAQVGVKTSFTASVKATTLAQRIQKGQNRGGTQIQNRIDILNKLLSRIQSMRNLSSSEKSSLTATIQTSITAMTSLETQIQSDASTTTLRADLRAIAPDYRIYMLIVPQISMLSAVDRVNTVVSIFQAIQTKIQTRLSADATLSGNATIAADMSDITAKLSDATSQASTAQNQIVSLVPDQGNQTVMQTNTATLKAARLNIKTATADLLAARKDVQSIIKLLIASDRSLGASASASTTTQ